ncbi:hypothetical protein EYM_01695 [Ignicoccus islandicus DSM 13165]|uniref:Uncharacterized protein n=1 Tax=Ignicoccus islandicus DSM 13165 TaxID=940295 RepID=A0A0U3F9B7_9CREN|nr:hypothetical protein [Ignicoccus islandicus]ALU12233.1 hypothetical protein EYM_01695 [Ignicoccus islandicus DSM 13165]
MLCCGADEAYFSKNSEMCIGVVCLEYSKDEKVSKCGMNVVEKIKELCKVKGVRELKGSSLLKSKKCNSSYLEGVLLKLTYSVKCSREAASSELKERLLREALGEILERSEVRIVIVDEGLVRNLTKSISIEGRKEVRLKP